MAAAIVGLVKAFIATACLIGFIFQVYDIWTAFVTGATNTATQYESNERLSLPTMTFCPKTPFKAKERGLNVDSYMKNSFQLGDIFEDTSMTNLSNRHLFCINETYSSLLGRCHVLRYIPSLKQNDYLLLHLRANASVHMFLHEELEEVWLARALTPHRFGYQLIDTEEWTARGVAAADIHIAKEVVTVLQRDGNCKHYDELNGFTRCILDRAYGPLRAQLNCTSPLLKPYMSPDLPQCNSRHSTDHKYLFVNITTRSVFDSAGLGCPPACSSVHYSSYLNYFHRFAVSQDLDEWQFQSGLTLFIYYDSTVVRKSSEVLIYNVASLLSAVGLFLGFSCLLVAHYAIDGISLILAKFVLEPSRRQMQNKE